MNRRNTKNEKQEQRQEEIKVANKKGDGSKQKLSV